MSRQALTEEELGNVTGGQITYTWNGEKGTIGLNGNNNLVLLDKAAFGEYYAANKDTMSEMNILLNLFAMGVITRP